MLLVERIVIYLQKNQKYHYIRYLMEQDTKADTSNIKQDSSDRLFSHSVSTGESIGEFSFLPISINSRSSSSVEFSFQSPLQEEATCRLLYKGKVVRSERIPIKYWDEVSFDGLDASKQYTLFCGTTRQVSKLPSDFSGAAKSVFIPAASSRSGFTVYLIIAVILVSLGGGFYLFLRQSNLFHFGLGSTFPFFGRFIHRVETGETDPAPEEQRLLPRGPQISKETAAVLEGISQEANWRCPICNR